MTYTTHRDTQETLQAIDRLDLDTDKPTEEEIFKKFGIEGPDGDLLLDDDVNAATRSGCYRLKKRWRRVKPRLWALFNEPHSSLAAKVRPGVDNDD